MRIPVRMGPLALLLSVISICMAVLSMLSLANSSADMRLAKRYANTVEIRYQLEEEGQRYLSQLDEDVQQIEKEFEKDGYRLRISLSRNEEGYEIRNWKIEKICFQFNSRCIFLCNGNLIIKVQRLHNHTYIMISVLSSPKYIKPQINFPKCL